MAESNLWQKSLRRSTSPSPLVRLQKPVKRGDDSLDDAAGKKTKRTTPAKIHKARRLSIVDEDDPRIYDDAAHVRQPQAGLKRPRPVVQQQQQQQKRQQPPQKKIAVATAAAAPLPNNENKKVPRGCYQRLKIPAPIPLAEPERNASLPPQNHHPLPLGVQYIDNDEDGMLEYWSEFTAHLRAKEHTSLFPVHQLSGGGGRSSMRGSDLEVNRSRLMLWLLDLSLHFRVSQETLYHTVRLVDTTLVRRDVHAEALQLVGITAFLIAAKLEEYAPPPIDDLVELTENSYTRDEVLEMEGRLLKVVGFIAHGVEPMIFLNRFIRAASREGDAIFKHTCLLLIDILIPNIEFSSVPSSVKAAAAVFGARQVLWDETTREQGGEEAMMTWTPTLAYYCGYSERELLPVAICMILKLEQALATMEDEGNGAKKPRIEIVRKYSSRSQHHCVVKHLFERRARVSRVGKAFLFLEKTPSPQS